MRAIIRNSRFRTALWRIGRKLYCLARGDLLNNPESNGEYWLLEQAIENGKGRTVLFDVGANRGDWTVHATEAASRSQQNVAVTAFEPCSETRELLRQRLSGIEAVTISNLALSRKTGTAEFYSGGAGAGTNSLSSVSGEAHETVQLSTIDAYLSQIGSRAISLLKIDTEGFDFDVLLGATEALSNGAIEIVQFEYNWRWLLNHRSLRDVFHFIKGKPYTFGKLNGESIEFHKSWHFEMDRFFENNYVLMRNDSDLRKLGRMHYFDQSNCAAPEIDTLHVAK
jgi:FkbM family methyltransferase